MTGDAATLDRDAVRELDRRAIAEYGMPSIVLMENAARACADEAQAMLGGAGGPVVVLCGPGNNGGDGLAIARTLHNRGFAAEAWLVGPRAKLEEASADVRTNAALWTGLGRTIETVETVADVPALLARLEQAALVVDALFGTGLTRPLREPWAAVVQAVAASGRPVLAVDLPSGLDADTGRVPGVAVRADRTVTFVARKPGFDRGRGPELCGVVRVAEIGIPRHLVDEALRRAPRP